METRIVHRAGYLGGETYYEVELRDFDGTIVPGHGEVVGRPYYFTDGADEVMTYEAVFCYDGGRVPAVDLGYYDTMDEALRSFRTVTPMTVAS